MMLSGLIIDFVGSIWQLTHLITSSPPHLIPLQTLAHGLGIQSIQGFGQKVWARRSRGKCMPITLR